MAYLCTVFSGLTSLQSVVGERLEDYWLAPSSLQMQDVSDGDRLSISTQWISKLSNHPDDMMFHDEVFNIYATANVGFSLVAFATNYSINEKSMAMGVGFGQLSIYVNSGNGESYAHSTNSYSGVDPYAHHDGNFSDFPYTSAAFGIDTVQGHLQFGQVAASADRLETRRLVCVDYSNDRLYARYTHIERGADSIGYGINAGLNIRRFAMGYQELSTRSDVSTRRIRFNWNPSTRNRFWLDFGVHKNPRLSEYTDTSIMFSWQRSLGDHSLVSYATDTGDSAEGEQTKATRRSGLGRGLLIGGGAVVAALVASSGSQTQDNAERGSSPGNRGAARSSQNGVERV